MTKSAARIHIETIIRNILQTRGLRVSDEHIASTVEKIVDDVFAYDTLEIVNDLMEEKVWENLPDAYESK